MQEWVRTVRCWTKRPIWFIFKPWYTWHGVPLTFPLRVAICRIHPKYVWKRILALYEAKPDEWLIRRFPKYEILTDLERRCQRRNFFYFMRWIVWPDKIEVKTIEEETNDKGPVCVFRLTKSQYVGEDEREERKKFLQIVCEKSRKRCSIPAVPKVRDILFLTVGSKKEANQRAAESYRLARTSGNVSKVEKDLGVVEKKAFYAKCDRQEKRLSDLRGAYQRDAERRKIKADECSRLQEDISSRLRLLHERRRSDVCWDGCGILERLNKRFRYKGGKKIGPRSYQRFGRFRRASRLVLRCSDGRDGESRQDCGKEIEISDRFAQGEQRIAASNERIRKEKSRARDQRKVQGRQEDSHPDWDEGVMEK